MTGEFTKKGLYAAEELLDTEYIACRKAQAYANTLTDLQLSEFFRTLASHHKARFEQLLGILEKE